MRSVLFLVIYQITDVTHKEGEHARQSIHKLGKKKIIQDHLNILYTFDYRQDFTIVKSLSDVSLEHVD